MLIGMQDDDDVALAVSPHARVRAHWIHARTHSQGTHARTHARTGPMHACTHWARAHCSHWVPTPARSRGPCTTLACTGSPRPLHLHARTHRVRVPMPTRSWGPCTHACTGSPCPLAHGVPTHACTGSCVHARAGPGTHARMLAPGPCAHARSGSPCLRGPHTCMHWAYARSIAGSPCTCARSLHSCMLHPMLYVVVVICSSSTVLHSSIMQ
jgi:hypothetical protein